MLYSLLLKKWIESVNIYKKTGKVIIMKGHLKEESLLMDSFIEMNKINLKLFMMI